MNDKALTILREVFGYETFRPLQGEIIRNVLDKKDTMVIMPTGGGKSLCYQIPALLFPGLTVVVSPLISLMKDQVEQLAAHGVDAVVLNSSLSQEVYRNNTELVRSGKARLLYVAPETLLTPRLQSLLGDLQLDCLTIDEAHCISEWGHDFRPEYRQLAGVRKRFPAAVCIALTATATPRVQQDIQDTLGFKEDNQFLASFNRENLFIRVVEKRNPLRQTIGFLREFPEKSGIIYCFSRRQVEELAGDLEAHGFSVRPYHAGLADEDRKRNQELFIRDDVQIIVATIAFGMGINKPNVRFVLHYDLPQNIESYYQQIGRAGRDGLRAECLLLFGYGDIAKIRFIIGQKEESEQRVANALLNALLSYAETHGCRRIPLLNYFGEKYKAGACGMCDNCLSPDHKLVDITVPAQMFLSCVKRTGERFGAGHIVDVLRASESKKVLSFGHQHLSTYGIGTEYTKKQWMQMSRQFIQQKLLTQDPKFGGLRLGPQAAGVLKSQKQVMGKIADEPAQLRIGDTPAPEYDVDLYTYLKNRRKHIADQEQVPPYVVFPDRTLMEMATYFPQSTSSLQHIHGVGRAKAEKYGPRFLRTITGYCHRKGIEDQTVGPSGGHASRPVRDGNESRFQQVGAAFSAGRSLAELQTEWHVQETTVVEHIRRYILEGHGISPERADELLSASSVTPDARRKVFIAFERLGSEMLRPAFEEMQGEVSYEQLRLLRLAFLIKIGGKA